jgi:catechol 2,3-dioxygenase-like lactoylglutathione lyase family enzyme
MEQRISIVTLGVADLERSRQFCERLGWRRSMNKAEGVVFFQVGGMALALYPRIELAKMQTSRPNTTVLPESPSPTTRAAVVKWMW